MRLIRNLFAVCTLAFTIAAAAETLVFPVQTHTLKNGMKVRVHEDQSIPNVALYIFYRVVSRNERRGITGLSHFFEHMMINVVKNNGPHTFDRTIVDAGGCNDAY